MKIAATIAVGLERRITISQGAASRQKNMRELDQSRMRLSKTSTGPLQP
jgi:hypothetical protein